MGQRICIFALPESRVMVDEIKLAQEWGDWFYYEGVNHEVVSVVETAEQAVVTFEAV
jgi:hypothetical protein